MGIRSIVPLLLPTLESMSSSKIKSNLIWRSLPPFERAKLDIEFLKRMAQLTVSTLNLMNIMNIIPSYELRHSHGKVDNSSETIVNSLFIGVTKIETHLNLTIRDFASLNVG